MTNQSRLNNENEDGYSIAIFIKIVKNEKEKAI